jgi:hypothetical protein
MDENLSSSVPEKIIDRKVIVYKTLVDPTVIKLTAEKVKGKFFRKYGFLKPPADQIKQVAFEKDYEPYFVIEGKYTIDYYRRRTYTIPIDENALEIILLNHTLKPEPTKEWKQNRAIKLEGEERLIHEDKAYLVLDVNGREVSPNRIPSAPHEEYPKKILAEYESARKLDFDPRKEVEILKSKIVKRPREIKRIVNELFEVSDRAVIYIPVYKIRFQNVKTGEQKTVKFNGVTAQLIHG